MIDVEGNPSTSTILRRDDAVNHTEVCPTCELDASSSILERNNFRIGEGLALR